ncbi:hypothetical protein [Pseudomonas phage LKD16]|uniref:Nucleotidyltransferase n=1 Tax=Pseudomonas phage LKD16 TaxID=386792 RepID=Q0E649_9CAUD|nr:nucleotidyltransferase [Pseudomonas phage LKD16]CAK25950.1 hypothetical protein [Pseudomonas phage LKD16]
MPLLNDTKEIKYLPPLNKVSSGALAHLALLSAYAAVRHDEGAALVGGAARDLYQQVMPRDIDLGFWSISDDRFLKVAGELEGRLGATWCEECDSYGDADTPFDRVVKLKGCKLLDNQDVDLLLYNCQTMGQVLDTFDYTLNQIGLAYVWSDPDDAPRLTARIHKDVEWGVNRAIRGGPRTEERAQRMLALTEQYGWENK